MITTAIRLFLILALLLVGVLAGSTAAGGQNPARNGAGLVIRHGDGTLVYAYVEFDSETISGEDLLLRSGLDFVVAPFGGLGAGVCAINGEGCPADDCYCQSFGNPAFYWNYYAHNGGNWTVQIQGPTGRQLGDGDIDGWSWTGGEHGLPATTIDEIAAITGLNRTPEATTTPTSVPTATVLPATATPTSTQSPAPTASVAALPTGTPVPPAPTMMATSSPTAVATSTTAPPQLPTPTATPTATTAAATVTTTSALPVTPLATPSAVIAKQPKPSATGSSGAVVVRPDATPEALHEASGSKVNSEQNVILFGGVALLVILGGFAALVLRRRTVT